MSSEPDQRAIGLLERLLETIQDLFIFQALEAGVTGETVKALLRVNTDRVTRVSKLRGKNSKRAPGAKR